MCFEEIKTRAPRKFIEKGDERTAELRSNQQGARSRINLGGVCEKIERNISKTVMSNYEKKNKILQSKRTFFRRVTHIYQTKHFRSESKWKKIGQANKSKGWMPWHQEPKKDAKSCEKPWGGAHIQRTRGIRMGKPSWEKLSYRMVNT